MNNDTLLLHTTTIVTASIAANIVPPEGVPGLIQSTYDALSTAGDVKVQEPEALTYEPAVSVRSSVKKDSITCLACGTTHKMLKRHLMSAHGLTPEEYRERYGLKADYPMVSPEYAEVRRELALKIGLGRGEHARGRTPRK